MTILYIGNELLKHGNTPSSIDTLAPQLKEYYEVLTASKKQNKFLRIIDMILSIVKNRNKVDYILIDTYSTSNFYYALLVSIIAKFYKIKYCPYLHGGNLPARLKSNPKLSNIIFKNAYMNIAPSGYLLDIFKKNNYKVKFIPNNINISIYPFKQRKRIRPNILFVRSFSKVYNPQLAVQVFAKIKEKYSEAKMCMVGPDKDGTLEQTKRLAIKLGLKNSIKFTGKLNKAEWIESSKDYDIFINPTNFDNQPVSIIEAMALGMPIVSTNVGGLPYLIDDNVDGLLVSSNNVKEFSDAIIKIIENDTIGYNLSLNARKKALLYDWDNVSLEWKAILK